MEVSEQDATSNLDANAFGKESVDHEVPIRELSHITTMSEKEQIEALVAEKEEMCMMFNTQRAKLKELFLNKEDELKSMKQEKADMQKQIEKLTTELNELKSQLYLTGLQLESNVETEKRKAAEEIASLQQLVQETVEASSSSQNEVKKLQTIIQHMEVEMQDLKQHSPHHTTQEANATPSLVLSAVSKLSKKLGADFFTSQDEDHNGDHELLKTLIGPLEEEIKALKDKLRNMDEELQRCKVQNCDMCRNYEDELVGEQKRVATLEAKLGTAEKAAERHKEDLLKEIGFRKDMEEKWNEKKEEHKKLSGELTARLERTEADLKEVQEACKQAYENMRESLKRLTRDREQVQSELQRLQNENDHLVGKYAVHSQVLQNEFIDLPSTVEELQEMVLRIQQDLIIAKIGKEAAEEEMTNLRSEIVLLKEQLQNNEQNYEQLQASFTEEHDRIKAESEKYQINLDRYKLREREANAKLAEKAAELERALQSKKEAEKYNGELQVRVTSLQRVLDNGEEVQKDFVRLSQNLQVQLEKIRAADTQVRWEHDEDVDECRTCRAVFATAARRKEHCRHCGQIFCTNCLQYQVLSGPHQRPSKVCEVCHTLLVKSAAPYFSTEAPHSPG